MPTRIIPPAQHRLMPWRNGGGRTAEIAFEPADSPAGFRWRLSLAEVESDGPFSTFPGCCRTISCRTKARAAGPVAIAWPRGRLRLRPLQPRRLPAGRLAALGAPRSHRGRR